MNIVLDSNRFSQVETTIMDQQSISVMIEGKTTHIYNKIKKTYPTMCRMKNKKDIE
jgi:hypothetical protein